MNSDPKHPITSLGVVGPLIAILVIIANHIHPGLGLTTQDLAPALDALDAIVGCVIAIVGRWKATQPISLSAPIRKPAPIAPPAATKGGTS